MCQWHKEHEKAVSPDLSRNRFIITSQIFSDSPKITAGHILGHPRHFHTTSWGFFMFQGIDFLQFLYSSVNLCEALGEKMVDNKSLGSK